MKRIIGLLALVAVLALPATSFAADKLPEGFIAMGEAKVNWEDAKAFCEQQGGRLPAIGGSESIDAVPKGTPIDGFGIVMETRWPKGLPDGFRDNYWTSTARTDTDRMWAVSEQNSYFSVSPHHPTASTHWALCVPK